MVGIRPDTAKKRLMRLKANLSQARPDLARDLAERTYPGAPRGTHRRAQPIVELTFTDLDAWASDVTPD